MLPARLELARPCERKILSLVCLPIPPWEHAYQPSLHHAFVRRTLKYLMKAEGSSLRSNFFIGVKHGGAFLRSGRVRGLQEKAGAAESLDSLLDKVLSGQTASRMRPVHGLG